MKKLIAIAAFIPCLAFAEAQQYTIQLVDKNTETTKLVSHFVLNDNEALPFIYSSETSYQKTCEEKATTNTGIDITFKPTSKNEKTVVIHNTELIAFQSVTVGNCQIQIPQIMKEQISYSFNLSLNHQTFDISNKYQLLVTKR